MTFNATEEGQILDHFVGGVSFPSFGAFSLDLAECQNPSGYTPCRVFPSDGGPQCEGYTPVAVNVSDWGLSSGGKISNINPFVFNVATADWTWTVGAWALFESYPSWVVSGPTSELKYIKKGERVVFAPGELSVLQNGGEPIYRGHFSNYAEDKILNHIFGKEDYPAQVVWVGLLANDPGEEGVYENNEVPQQVGGQYTGYGRIYVPPTHWWHPRASTGNPQYVANYHGVTFPEALKSWGTVRYFALFDNPVYGAGHILIYGVLGWDVAAWSSWEYNGGPPPEAIAYYIEAGSQPLILPDDLGIWFTW